MITEFHTTDFDQFAAAQQSWDLRYRPLGKNSFDGTTLSIGLGGIQIDVERYNTPVEITGTAPGRGLSCVLPASQNGPYCSSGHEITSDQIDVFGGGHAIDALTSSNCHLLSVTVSNNSIKSFGDSPLVELLIGHIEGHSVIRPDQAAMNSLRTHCFELVDSYRNSKYPTNCEAYLLDEMLCLISFALDDREDALSKNALRQFRLAKNARNFMLERKSDPPLITEICASLGVPERTLYNAFTRTFGTTPKRFIKTQRLFAVHRELKTAGEKQSIYDIAARYGFWDHSNFTRDYKALFGELPSTSLARN